MYQTLSRNLIVALSLSSAVFAQSQPADSLGDAARANRAQQQSQEASGTMPKVITNQDLPPGSTRAPQSTTSDTMTMVSGVTRPNHYPDQRFRDESFNDQRFDNRQPSEQRAGQQWRSRIQNQESRIEDLQARIDRLNAFIHTSSGTAQYEAPVNRYQAMQMQRLAMMQEVMAQQKRRLEMMQEAARRSGMND
jgi:hypothetical protein